MLFPNKKSSIFIYSLQTSDWRLGCQVTIFWKHGFQLTVQLVNRPVNDEEDEEIWEESDVECDGEEDSDRYSIDPACELGQSSKC